MPQTHLPSIKNPVVRPVVYSGLQPKRLLTQQNEIDMTPKMCPGYMGVHPDPVISQYCSNSDVPHSQEVPSPTISEGLTTPT